MNAKEGSFGKPFLSKRFVGIAIVLCLLFLVAIPGIAAEQATQKVSASEVTTASEDDFVLDIYGNANEDDTIDMRDLTYVKLIFFGKKLETELADAKYDGKINPLDFVQIKLIIVGKEKELTLIDSADRIVTVKKPVERVVSMSLYCYEAIRMFGELDKIVGIEKNVNQYPTYFPEGSKFPCIGGYPPDAEAILSLEPDLVVGATSWTKHLYDKLSDSVPVVGLNFMSRTHFVEETVKFGYIMNKRDKADNYLKTFCDKYLDTIKARTGRLSEDEKPKVYVESSFGDYKAYGGGSGAQTYIEIAGGRNIFSDSPSYSEVDPEAVMARNPDIIIKHLRKGAGYETDDPSVIVDIWQEIMNRPELANVTAVKNGNVYIIHEGLSYGFDHPIAIAYMAKWFHPDLFTDLDPQAMHQEFIDNFCPGLDFNVYEHGIFVYPPLEE
ncbi:hypothetical protein DRN97_07355 [Methanosarcinales archaeon]|nr:MAG: hypothetical protein DRN97_07355 [Methanosarcinales archaeon]